MKAQVKRINDMSAALEHTGFSRQQSKAVIETVASAMETFAVTPEILETRLNAHTKEILRVVRREFGVQRKDMAAHRRETADHGKILQQHTETLKQHGEILQQHTETLRQHGEILRQHGEILGQHGETLRHNGESIAELQRSFLVLKSDMLDFQRNMTRTLMSFIILLLTAVLGIFGMFASELFFF